MTFREWNERSCRLANALAGMGVKKGDRFAILAYNCVEWMEIYAAAAKGGQITVPIMFRLAPPEMEYVINHSECKAFIVAKDFVQTSIPSGPSFHHLQKRTISILGMAKHRRDIDTTNPLWQRPHPRSRM